MLIIIFQGGNLTPERFKRFRGKGGWTLNSIGYNGGIGKRITLNLSVDSVLIHILITIIKNVFVAHL